MDLLNSPLISIIMPAYNSEEYISESIDSVLTQTYNNWELVIVDDGSIDNTREVIRKYEKEDIRIKYLYQTNQRQGKARNNGIKHSTGSLIAFLDSDDIWVNSKLELQVKELIKNDVDLVFSDGFSFSDSIETSTGIFDTIKGYYKGDEVIKLFLIQNRIPILSVLTKRVVISEVGGFIEKPEIQNVEDYHLWLKILFAGYSIYGMPDKLFYYRQHVNQSTYNDTLNYERVILMFSRYLQVPQNFDIQKEKTKLTWIKDWYCLKANSKKSGFKILQYLINYRILIIIPIITLFVLFLVDLNTSKKVLRKLIKIKNNGYL